MKSVFEELLHRTVDSPIQTILSRNIPEQISRVICARLCAHGLTYNIKRSDFEQLSCRGNQQARNFRLAE